MDKLKFEIFRLLVSPTTTKGFPHKMFIRKFN